MRIHGEEHIIRTQGITGRSNYQDYRSTLRVDFKRLCGYCGKPEKLSIKGFEIDHFVPNSIDADRKTDYTNLVYSCFTCNRKKSGKWPTNDKDLHHDGIFGFIDPASDDYDSHLYRNEAGIIEYRSSVGQYMCDIAFEFCVRPIQEIWKCTQILSKKKELYDRRQNLNEEQLREYLVIDHELDELMEYLFDKRE